MDAAGAIVFLPREGSHPSVMLEPILFDPAALWLCCELEREGVRRFLVVCDEADQAAAADCFPENTQFITTGAKDAPQRLGDFLAEVSGAVTVVTRPVLLAPQGAHFALDGKASQSEAVCTIRPDALSSALRGGQELYIPKRESLEREARDRDIRAQFDGGNYRALAARFQLSERQIRKILKGTRT